MWSISWLLPKPQGIEDRDIFYSFGVINTPISCLLYMVFFFFFFFFISIFNGIAFVLGLLLEEPTPLEGTKPIFDFLGDPRPKKNVGSD
jgi:hypothetical protein